MQSLKADRIPNSDVGLKVCDMFSDHLYLPYLLHAHIHIVKFIQLKLMMVINENHKRIKNDLKTKINGSHKQMNERRPTQK